jgi:hypothetical protein
LTGIRSLRLETFKHRLVAIQLNNVYMYYEPVSLLIRKSSGKSASPYCPHCGDGLEDTPQHVILHCPQQANLRSKLVCKLGRAALSLSFLLSTKTAIVPALKLLINTKRLNLRKLTSSTHPFPPPHPSPPDSPRSYLYLLSSCFPL